MTPTTTSETFRGFSELAGTRRFTVADYHRLIDAGILGPDDKVELLEGYILFKAEYPELRPADTVLPEWRALRPWTSSEYHRMLDLGVIGREEKLELLDGYLVLKMPQSTAHRTSVVRLTSRLAGQLPAGWVIMTQIPVSLPDRDPEPDGAILRGADSDYDTRDPNATDFGIVVEVSDSTLDLDRSAKGRMYARAGLPVYWIINVAEKQIEVYTDPDASAAPPAYKTRTDYKPGDAVPVTLDGNTVGAIPVSELVP